jgi:PKD repeat protein
MNVTRPAVLRPFVGFVALAMLTVGLTAVEVGTAPPAAADTVPAAGVPETVSADALPTTQINGVAWQQAIAGDTVFVGGDFQNARPAGAAAGVNTVPRANLLAYDITTGVLDSTWAPDPNGQVRAVVTSPDGTRLYVGGSFTSIAGVSRYRIAAFDTATGALIASFNAGTNSQVRAIAATNTAVYVGGTFTEAGGQPRTRLAAFTSSGTLLPWNPTVDNGSVSALTVSPDGSVVVAGGNFTSVNASTANAYGMARLDGTTGATLSFPANTLVRDAGTVGSILNLTGDATNFYGVGYTYGRSGGTLEGIFSADWATGELTWIQDCHGDSYAVYADTDVIYSASHHHYCGNLRSITQPDEWNYYRANAFTKVATQTLGREHLSYTNFEGQAAPTQLDWAPDLDTGTYTGQNQGPWAVTGNGQYVVYGGEFLNVNYKRQQGLVRFAVRDIAPNKEGPRMSGADFTPVARPVASGAVRVYWQANVDFDNEFLTYRVIRDGNTASPVWTGTAGSHRWERRWMGFTDTGLAAGSSHTYRVSATDAFGNVVTSPTVTVTASGTGTLSAYARTVEADGASQYWRLGDGAGTTALDSASGFDATAGTAMTKGAAGAIVGDADTAFTLTNSTNSRVVAPQRVLSTNTLSVEAWIKTTSSQGGRIVGFGASSSLTGTSANRDRHLYMDNQGRLLFGVSPGQNRAVASGTGYNDGQWHHVVGTLGADGVALWVDGTKVASNTAWTTGRNMEGYWRIGGDSLQGWTNQPSSMNFTGSVDEVAIYPTVLTPEQIASHNTLGRTGAAPNVAPTASFTATVTNLGVSVDASASSDTDGTVAGYAWDFGDGGTGTGVTATHTYAAAGTYTVSLTVTDNSGATGSTTRVVTATPPPPNQAPTASFTTTVTGLGVAVNAAASSDPDGTVAGYAWDFGDGSTGTGVTASHTYAAVATYTITLTVTDNGGATASTTRTVTTTTPPDPGAFAADSFTRTVSSGWGTADAGGPWTVVSGGATNFSVASGAGVMRIANAGWTASAVLSGVSQTQTETQVTLAMDKLATGGGTDIEVAGRAVGTNQGYRLKLKMLSTGVIRASLNSVVGSTTTVLTQLNLPGLTYAAGDKLRVRLQVDGTSPTTLRAKVWRVGDTEPTAWTLTTTDSAAALQVAGGIGLQAYASSSATNAPQTVTFDDLWVGAPGTFPVVVANVAPVAAFTAGVTDLAVAVDGSASTDSDGTLSAYAWDFGDGATATGPTASHTYAAAGTYPVVLTVTDNAGATGTTSQQVTVTEPVPPPVDVFAADAFARTVADGWGSADVGGAWTLTGGTTRFSVADGVGTMRADGAGWRLTANLPEVAQASTEVRVGVGVDAIPTNSWTELEVAGRTVGVSDGYRVKLRLLSTGVVRASLVAQSGGTTTTLTQVNVAGLTYVPGDTLRVRLQVTGASPTTLRVKVWQATGTEPTAWTLTTTDATAALQTTGGVGLQMYTSSSTAVLPLFARFRDLAVGAPTP